MIWEGFRNLFGVRDEVAEVFREEWVALLEKDVPLYARLPEDLRLAMHERIGRFIATVRFEGCGGLELTEDMILTVAAQACLLVIRREGPPYPRLKAVYLYPSTFSSVRKRMDAVGIVTEGEVHRLGESWDSGTVILAWDSVERGARRCWTRTAGRIRRSSSRWRRRRFLRNRGNCSGGVRICTGR